jgi:hypothetical protein
MQQIFSPFFEQRPRGFPSVNGNFCPSELPDGCRATG